LPGVLRSVHYRLPLAFLYRDKTASFLAEVSREN
jgi:hypothetical protein